jgi:hypothetical protein
VFGIKWSDVVWADLEKPLYSGLAARIAIAQQTSKDIPRSVEDQAALWAEHHQTIAETATMEKRFNDYADSVSTGIDTNCL